MQTKFSWFPIVLGTFWALFMALAMVNFAGFTEATQKKPQGLVQTVREKVQRTAAGRRPNGRGFATALRLDNP